MTEEFKQKLIDLYNEADVNSEEKYALEHMFVKLKLGYYTHKEVWAEDNTVCGWKSIFHFGSADDMTEDDRCREGLYEWDQADEYENHINSEYNRLNRW